jgi:hypothetical protein
VDEQTNVQANRIDYTPNGGGNQPPEQCITFVPSRNGCFEVLGHGDHRPLGMVLTATIAYQVRLGRLHSYTAHEGEANRKLWGDRKERITRRTNAIVIRKERKKTQEKRKNENGSSEHPKGDRSNNKSFYCTEHGKNLMHATADCFTIKNRDKSSSQGANRSFSNKSFRKEVTFLAKKSSKKKVLDMYMADGYQTRTKENA